MNIKSLTKLELIAPCGMNCGVCMAYLREKNHCPGCRGKDSDKPGSCARCIIKNCYELKKNKMKFCSSKCRKFPCDRLKHLDKRYRTKYHMSMIENLDNITRLGIRAFVRNEEKRWTCKKCGGAICVHRYCCSSCGKKKG
jgi:hypothetical protein